MLKLPQAIELAEKIKKSYRAKWDEVRYQDERTGEVSPTQYDLSLELKGGKETLDFSYRLLDGEDKQRWYFRQFEPVDNADGEWTSRHERIGSWLAVPDMLASSLWDIVTVHGEEAAQRGWSEIDRKDVEPSTEGMATAEVGGE